MKEDYIPYMNNPYCIRDIIKEGSASLASKSSPKKYGEFLQNKHKRNRRK